jgi:hypothetical protein
MGSLSTPLAAGAPARGTSTSFWRKTGDNQRLRIPPRGIDIPGVCIIVPASADLYNTLYNGFITRQTQGWSNAPGSVPDMRSDISLAHIDAPALKRGEL